MAGIPAEKLIRAYDARGKTFAWFGRPDITFTCGACFSVWKTDLWFQISGPKGVASTCSVCHMVNYTGWSYGPSSD